MERNEKQIGIKEKTAFAAFCLKYVYGLAAFAASYQKTNYSTAFAAFAAFAAKWPSCYIIVLSFDFQLQNPLFLLIFSLYLQLQQQILLLNVFRLWRFLQ